jgi:hypothetical protein
MLHRGPGLPVHFEYVMAVWKRRVWKDICIWLRQAALICGFAAGIRPGNHTMDRFRPVVGKAFEKRF